MAQAEPSLDGAQTKTGTEVRVFDAAEPVDLTAADVLTLVHGDGVGPLNEQQDTKAKIGEASAAATNGAAGDKPVERSDSVAVVTGQAIPGGAAEEAETSEDILRKLFDPAYIQEFLSREDVQRNLAVLTESLGEIDLSDCDEDQWRL